MVEFVFNLLATYLGRAVHAPEHLGNFFTQIVNFTSRGGGGGGGGVRLNLIIL